MKRLLISIYLLAAAVFAPAARAQVSVDSTTSGTVTVTQARGAAMVAIAWTSNADGEANATLSGFRGRILRVVTNPDDTAAPSDNYDVTASDVDGLDVLEGLGANRDTADSEEFVPLIGDGVSTDHTSPVVGTLTIDVSSAGNAKQGVLRFYFEPFD